MPHTFASAQTKFQKLEDALIEQMLTELLGLDWLNWLDGLDGLDMLDVLVLDVDLKRVPVLIVLAAVRTSYCLLCTRVYVLHVANKVLCRDIFITSLTVDLTCKLIKAHSWSRTINIVYHSQMFLTGWVVFENLLAHWTLDLIVCSMHISCVPWVVLGINVLIAVSTENCPCKELT